MFQDIRFAIRRMALRPAHTLLTVATIALGIGASTAVFSVVDQTVLRPAPFAHADRLVDVLHINRKTGSGGSDMTAVKVLGWQAQPSVFERLEMYAGRSFDVTSEGEPERVRGLQVSTGLFEMLGVQPRLGRRFGDGDGRPESDKVAIISEDLWQRRFGGEPDVLGSTIALNDEPHTIVGVMPRRFRLQGDNEAVWVPYHIQANETVPSLGGFYGLGRLAPGVSQADAQALSDRIGERMEKETPIPATWALRVTPKQVARVNDTTRTALFVLLGAVGFVLLTTCANVANLFLTQAARRQREMAVRSAIGASRGRLMRDVMVESLLLAGIGGVLGIVLANWGVQALVAAAPSNLAFQATSPVEVDGRIVAVAAGVTLLSGLLFGIVPALRGSRPNLDATLRGSDTSAGARTSYGRVPGMLVVAEVAFSLILLVGAALMVRTLANLEAIDPGFAPEGLVAMSVDLPTDKYPTAAGRREFFETLRQRLIGSAGVTDMAVAIGVPPGGGGITFGTPMAEGGAAASKETSVIPFNTVTPDFFRTLRIPLVAGRTFEATDTVDDVVVSRAFAEKLWPSGSALGRRFRMSEKDRWKTVVGVAENVESRAGGEERTLLQFYYPWVPPAAAATAAAPAPPGNPAAPRRRNYDGRILIVRAENPSAAIPVVKEAIWAMDRSQPVERVRLVTDMYAATFARQRFVLLLMTAFAIVALTLTAAGVFAVLSQAVSQRTREIGIRVALGARPADVMRLVLSRGMLLTAVGAAIGLAGAFSLTRFLDALLFEVEPYDPLSFTGVTLLLAVVALMACWLPTRTAMRVQPATALRAE